MTNLLIRIFIKDRESTDKKIVRKKYINLGSGVGVCCNIILFLIKIIIGILSGSVSITADAFNNLSDIGSSAVTAIGYRLSEKPADKEHPFGHGRIEYMSALAVAILIILVGVELLKSSVQKVFNPSALNIETYTVVILFISVVIKLWMFVFNRKIGKKIKSSALIATAQDSINDVAATSAVLVSILICGIFKINIDPYMGIAVALFIIYSGFNTMRETINPLLGMPADPDTVKKIKKTVLSYDGFLGLHDLIIHNYGPGRSFASLHVEVPSTVNIVECHEKIDSCELRLSEELNMEVVIHMDPIVISDERVVKTRQRVSEVLKELDPKLSMHDFRMVDGNEQINLIFDIVVPQNFSMTNNDLKKAVAVACKQIDHRFETIITLDSNYNTI